MYVSLQSEEKRKKLIEFIKNYDGLINSKVMLEELQKTDKDYLGLHSFTFRINIQRLFKICFPESRVPDGVGCFKACILAIKEMGETIEAERIKQLESEIRVLNSRLLNSNATIEFLKEELRRKEKSWFKRMFGL